MQKVTVLSIANALVILAITPVSPVDAQIVRELDERPLCQFEVIAGQPDPLPLQPADSNEDGLAFAEPAGSDGGYLRYTELDCRFEAVTGQPDPLPLPTFDPQEDRHKNR